MVDQAKREQFEFALAGLRKLEALHADFLAHLGKLKSFEGGSLAIQGGQISVVCLGISIKVGERYIAKDSQPSLIEYEFSTEHDDGKLPLFYLYLRANGRLFGDSDCTKSFADFDNQYLLSHLIGELADKLLKSEVFKPSL